MKRPFFQHFLIATLAAPASARQTISIHDRDESGPAHAPAFQWREARVDPSGEHFELRYGSSEDDWENWTLIARVGHPIGGIFQVEWLIRDNAAHHEIISAVKDQLNYYLVELDKCDPWNYLEYHVTTLANLYSDVHWSHAEAR
jgi:hypothetical protein